MKLASPLNLISHAMKVYENPETVAQLQAVLRLGTPSGSQIPQDLFKLGVKMHLRGILNTLAIQANRSWIWPYWVERQFDPKDPGFVPRSHALAHMNLTRRNWTIVGCPGTRARGVVDPCGLITPRPESWSLDCWVREGDSLYAPSRLKKVRQSLHHQAPMVKTQYRAGGLEVKSRLWALLVDGVPHLALRALLHNRSRICFKGSFYLAVRPYNPEGISLIHNLEFLENQTVRVNGEDGLFLLTPPDSVYCADAYRGDVSQWLGSGEQARQVHCPLGLATGMAEYRLNLPGHQEQEITVLMPMENSKPAASAAPSPTSFSCKQSQQDFMKQWEQIASSHAILTFPSRRLTESFRANKAYMHIFDRGQQMTPGALTYSACWVRDAAFMLHALDKLGFHAQAEQKIWHLLKKQSKEGNFSQQEGEWDANGQVAWAILQHYHLTGNRLFLENAYPALAKGGRWVQLKRKAAAAKGSPLDGLLPAGFSAEHLGPPDHYYWDNFWGVAALNLAGEAAKLLGRADEHTYWLKQARGYWRDIELSIQLAAKHDGLEFLPATPTRGLDSGAIGSLCAVYPLNLLPAQHPRVLNTLRLLEEHYLLGEGFFQEHFHSGVNSYLSAHLAQCYLQLADPRAWLIARYLLKHASATYAWPEAFHPITLGGCMGEGHHGWAAAEWILLLRNLLFHEKGKNLIITPLLREADLQPGKTFTVHDAPSSFGRITFTVHSGKRETILELANEYELGEPKALHWKLPFPPSVVTVDDETRSSSDSCLILSPKASRVVIKP